MKVPLNVIGGFLGTGKTTAILDLVRSHGGRVAVVVNDFGEAAMDALTLEGAASVGPSGTPRVTNIPGGCVCCTAPEGLAPAVLALLDEADHVLVEPSGLARPQDLVDMLSRGPVAARVEIGPTVILVDPSRAPGDDVEAEQWEAADVLVANRTDLARPAQLEAFRARAAARWPAPRVVETTFGRIDWALLRRAPSGPAAPPAEGGGAHDHGHDHDHAPSTEGFDAASAELPAGVVLDWQRVRALVGGAERFKGLLHTDAGWLRVDVAGGVLHQAPTAWRSGSRWDVIVRGGGARALSDALAAARSAALDGALAGGEAVEVVSDAGVTRWDRARCAALPGQIEDVGALVPGRVGKAVPLAALVSGVGTFVVRAVDGLTTAPAPIASAADAVLVYALGEGPLPTAQGGPFRILVLPSAGRSPCANVKGVAQVRLLP